MAASACSGGRGQTGYSYAGCDGGTYVCPNDLAFYCALQTIQAKHNQCTTAADCVVAPTANCVGFLTGCPPAAVRLQQRDAFLDEAAAEASRYCDGARCMGSAVCAFSYADGGVTCMGGRCVAVPD